MAKTDAEKIAVMQGFVDGRQIEIKLGGDWSAVGQPRWSWSNCDYRIKPEPAQPEYRPFANAEEFKPHRDKWVYFGIYQHRVGGFSDRGVFVCLTEVGYGTLLEYYQFEDGTPCGVPCGVKL